MSTALLEMQDIVLTFPGAEKPVLSKFNYQVNKRDFVVILGSNGSGKSSLLKLLSQRYQSDEGKIYFEKKLLKDYPEKKLSREIKTLTQSCDESLFFDLSVLENYILVKQQYEPRLLALTHKKAREFLKNYLLKFNANLALKLDQRVDQLSGGEKQALALALVVLYPPHLLLLDEHTSALDPHASEQLMLLTQKIITEYHITCLLTTHDLAIAEAYGNRVLALKSGEIYFTVEDDKKEKLNRHDLLKHCY
jgi:putative ABC transport system ATP-binding protein